MNDAIRILHVDDDPQFMDLSTRFLRKYSEQFEVITKTHPTDAVDYLLESEQDVHCLVSDYELPEMNGIELLEVVRKDYPDLPFILYTGKGSEDVASDAISNGVTDYLQKASGTSQYQVLANRIQNAVGQHRAQEEIDETRDRFQNLVRHSTDVISIVDAEGQWQYLTPSAERILGYPPEELIGESGFDYIHPDDRPDAIETFEKAMETPDKIPETEFRFDHPTEGWVWTHNSARNMLDDPLIEGFIVHTRDISVRKAKELELERHSHRLDLALEATDTGVWEWDMETDEVVWSETLEQLLGIEPGTFDGTYEAHAEYLHPDDISEVERAAKEAIEGDGIFNAEFRMIREDGEHIWVHGRAKHFSEDGPERMLGTTTDITERRERERELKDFKSKAGTATAEKERQTQAFHIFQDIVTDSTRTFDQQMQDALSLGVDFLDLDIGLISKIEPPDYTVEHVVTPDGSIEQGDVLDYSDTFCTLVYESDEPVAFRSPMEGDVEDHPCYQDLGLQAYLGEPLLVDGQRYGTLNFSSPSPRGESFTDGERAFIRTVSGWVTMKLSRHQRDQEC